MELDKIKGLRTFEEIQEILKISRNYAWKLLSNLRKEGYVTTTGGGKQKRIYKITTYKQTPSNGMFDIINKYSRLKVQPLFKHVAVGKYKVENVLVDAIRLRKKRIILASLPLFNHIDDWTMLKNLAKKYKLEPQLGFLYDTARSTIKTRKMPKHIYDSLEKAKVKVDLIDEKTEEFNTRWNCFNLFSNSDLMRLKK